MSKYIVRPGEKQGEFVVIEIHNGRGRKKLGPYLKWKAIAIAKKYTEQDKVREEKEKRASELRKAQLTAHRNLPKGKDLSQIEAINEIEELRKRLREDNKK